MASTSRSSRQSARRYALAIGAGTVAVASLAPGAWQPTLAGNPGAVAAASRAAATATPIKHVVVIIGENHSFDNVFATYQPPRGQSVRNLLSQGIVTLDGVLGSGSAQSSQVRAVDTTTSDPPYYSLTPRHTGLYEHLPRPNTTYAPTPCTGQPTDSPDARFPATLPNGPYQITRSVPYLDNHGTYGGGCEFYGAYVGDPIHRFYQMWQQVGNGSSRQFTWVTNTAGDDNGAHPPAPIYQGGVQMGYYNMAGGDAPVLRNLALNYAMSDNYHQSVMGGTGANHIMLGTGDMAYYQGRSGAPLVPPANEIENPNPKPGTNNNYRQDGYAGGSYSNCSDRSQPGVAAVFDRLNAQPYEPFRGGDCQHGAYYLLNNYNAGYNVDGTVNTSPFTVPPQSFPTIGDELSARNISWGYFGEGYNNGHPTSQYCGICNPFQYATSVMTNPAKRANIQHDSSDFDRMAAGGTLPAVSFLKPGDDDGHPGYSTLASFESFVGHAVSEVQNQPTLWKNTAFLVTFDEGGGYYDSGYIQPTSFFGDGTRVPLLVISPFTRKGYIDHTYEDHVSILKFIETNWQLTPLSRRSQDNLPNPASSLDGGYVPGNRPAVGNLMSLFDFSRAQAATSSAPVTAAPATRAGAFAAPGLNR